MYLTVHQVLGLGVSDKVIALSYVAYPIPCTIACLPPCTQADLLQALDASCEGLTTSLVRTWSGPEASLELRGRWKGGLEARRMAMLAVYQVSGGSIA